MYVGRKTAHYAAAGPHTLPVTFLALLPRYFAPAGEENATRGTTLRSLRHAFGPQLGTVCFAGAVIAVAQYVKSLADRCAGSEAWVPEPARASASQGTGCTGYLLHAWAAAPPSCPNPACRLTHPNCRLPHPCSMQRRGGLLGCLLSYPLRWAAVALQELTKFAVITAAITGEGLKDAGRRTLELLKRNALEAFVSGRGAHGRHGFVGGPCGCYMLPAV